MKIALLSLLTLTSISLFAQEEREVVVIRRETSPKTYKRKAERDIDNYNAFKFDPLRMAIGELNFSWEHRIGDHTTFEVEAGPTISNLGIGRFDIVDQYPGSYEKGSLMGGLISAAVRYYPLEESKAMNKLYVSPRLKYRRYNDSYTASPGTNVSNERGGSNEFIFSFNVGFQDWVSHNFAFDYYIGVGIGSYSGNQFQLGEVYDGNTGTWTYKWTESRSDYARFIGVIGLKVAVGN